MVVAGMLVTKADALNPQSLAGVLGAWMQLVGVYPCYEWAPVYPMMPIVLTFLAGQFFGWGEDGLTAPRPPADLQQGLLPLLEARDALRRTFAQRSKAGQLEDAEGRGRRPEEAKQLLEGPALELLGRLGLVQPKQGMGSAALGAAADPDQLYRSEVEQWIANTDAGAEKQLEREKGTLPEPDTLSGAKRVLQRKFPGSGQVPEAGPGPGLGVGQEAGVVLGQQQEAGPGPGEEPEAAGAQNEDQRRAKARRGLALALQSAVSTDEKVANALSACQAFIANAVGTLAFPVQPIPQPGSSPPPAVEPNDMAQIGMQSVGHVKGSLRQAVVALVRRPEVAAALLFGRSGMEHDDVYVMGWLYHQTLAASGCGGAEDLLGLLEFPEVYANLGLQQQLRDLRDRKDAVLEAVLKAFAEGVADALLDSIGEWQQHSWDRVIMRTAMQGQQQQQQQHHYQQQQQQQQHGAAVGPHGPAGAAAVAGSRAAYRLIARVPSMERLLLAVVSPEGPPSSDVQQLVAHMALLLARCLALACSSVPAACVPLVMELLVPQQGAGPLPPAVQAGYQRVLEAMGEDDDTFLEVVKAVPDAVAAGAPLSSSILGPTMYQHITDLKRKAHLEPLLTLMERVQDEAVMFNDPSNKAAARVLDQALKGKGTNSGLAGMTGHLLSLVYRNLHDRLLAVQPAPKGAGGRGKGAAGQQQQQQQQRRQQQQHQQPTQPPFIQRRAQPPRQVKKRPEQGAAVAAAAPKRQRGVHPQAQAAREDVQQQPPAPLPPPEAQAEPPGQADRSSRRRVSAVRGSKAVAGAVDWAAAGGGAGAGAGAGGAGGASADAAGGTSAPAAASAAGGPAASLRMQMAQAPRLLQLCTSHHTSLASTPASDFSSISTSSWSAALSSGGTEGSGPSTSSSLPDADNGLSLEYLEEMIKELTILQESSEQGTQQAGGAGSGGSAGGLAGRAADAGEEEGPSTQEGEGAGAGLASGPAALPEYSLIDALRHTLEMLDLEASAHWSMVEWRKGGAAQPR